MLVSIIKREFQDNLFSFKFSLTLIICLVLFLTSAYLMTEDYQKRVQQYSTTRSQQERPIEERQPIPLLSATERLSNFKDVRLGFSEGAAIAEAERCLNCAGHLCKDVCP